MDKSVCDDNVEVENVIEEPSQFDILEETMELLELEDSVVPEVSETSEKCSKTTSTTNRRYTLRPQRRLTATKCDKYTVSSSKKNGILLAKKGLLETIFENPVSKDGTLLFLSKRPVKRALTFNESVSKTKIKNRKTKVKRLLKSTARKKCSKFTIEDVKRKLKCLEDESNDEDEWMDIKD